MTLKKIVAGLIIAVTALTMASCSNDKIVMDANAGKDKIVMATNAGFPPFEYVTTEEKGLHGRFSGVDIAIALEIAKELDMELVIEDMEFSAVLLNVPSGKADMALAGMSIKPDRLENMDFSHPYYTAQQVMIVDKDNDTIASAADLEGIQVGVIQGYTGQEACENLGLTGIQSYMNATSAIMALQSKKVDAVVLDLHTAVAFVSMNDDLKYVEDHETFDKEEYAVAVKKGNTELLDTINTVLDRLLEDGTINKWADEHAELSSALE